MIAPALAPATFTHFFTGLSTLSANPSSAPASPSPFTPPPRKTPSASSIQSIVTSVRFEDQNELRNTAVAVPPFSCRWIASSSENLTFTGPASLPCETSIGLAPVATTIAAREPFGFRADVHTTRSRGFAPASGTCLQCASSVPVKPPAPALYLPGKFGFGAPAHA